MNANDIKNVKQERNDGNPMHETSRVLHLLNDKFNVGASCAATGLRNLKLDLQIHNN